jgi:hypothetical protein
MGTAGAGGRRGHRRLRSNRPACAGPRASHTRRDGRLDTCRRLRTGRSCMGHRSRGRAHGCRYGRLTIGDGRRRGGRRHCRDRRRGRSGRQCRRLDWRVRSRRRHGRGRHAALRQQRQRIDVPLRIVRAPDAEVNVRHVVLRIAGGPDRRDGLAFGDAVVGVDTDRAEMEERDGEAVECPDRHGQAVGGQSAGERDSSAGRRGDSDLRVAADIDAGMAVLAVLGAAEVEAAQHRPVSRPRPGRRWGRRDESQRD